MSDLIKVDTGRVAEIANNLDGLNQELQTNLKEVQTTINNLSATWTGNAANATREAIDSFAKDYFQNYYDLIDQYVEFLRKNVVQGYEGTESTNTSLADSFK